MPVHVMQSGGETWTTAVDGPLGIDHPARNAAPGDSFEFEAEDKSTQKQHYLGKFDVVADLRRPTLTGRGERITLLAEHHPTAQAWITANPAWETTPVADLMRARMSAPELKSLFSTLTATA